MITERTAVLDIHVSFIVILAWIAILMLAGLLGYIVLATLFFARFDGDHGRAWAVFVITATICLPCAMAWVFSGWAGLR